MSKKHPDSPSSSGAAQAPRRSFVQDAEAWTFAIVENAVDGIITIDESGIIEYFNPSAERIFGYSSEEVSGRNVSMLMPSPYREEHDAYLYRYLSSGNATIVGLVREVVGRRKDGSVFPMELSVSEVHLGERRIFTGIVHDITRRKQAELEKNRLLRDLNKRNIEITCLYRVEESIRSRRYLGEIFSDVAGLVRQACLHPEQARARVTFDGEVHEQAAFEKTEWRLAADIVVAGRKRGLVEVYYIEDFPDQDEGPFLREERDLIDAIAHVLGETVERREAEAQVIQASKLASIGELAAGVGHEINNPLNGIINCADILIKNAKKDSKQRQFSELIRAESERIANIVRGLLAFSRQERGTFRLERICDVVDAVLSLSRKKIAKSNVDLRVDVPEDLPMLLCSSERLQQVLMNLLINSLHALDERLPGADSDKVLALTACTVEHKGKPYLRLTVEDHGCGIAPENMERMFDPFFTTKGRDKGTGLGLSVSDGIVKDHGGMITVQSEVGRFARFHVDLPMRPETGAGTGAAAEKT